MARYFTRASNEYLINSSAVVSAEPLTMACWFYSVSATDAQTLMSINEEAINRGWVLFAQGAVAGDPVRLFAWGDTSSQGIDTSSGYSVNTWHHACGVCTANDDRKVYIDGGNSSTGNTNIGDFTAENTTIGARYTNGPSVLLPMDGRVAEAAIWNVAMSDDEVAALAAGASPLTIRTQNLVAYWPLWRDEDQDYVGGYNMTAINTPSI